MIDDRNRKNRESIEDKLLSLWKHFGGYEYEKEGGWKGTGLTREEYVQRYIDKRLARDRSRGN